MSKRIDVVFTRDLEGVAREGELKSVSSGFWRNYLLPRGLAVSAETREARSLQEKHQVVAEGAEVAIAEAAEGQVHATVVRQEKRAMRAERKEEKRKKDVKKAAKMKQKEAR